ncbi:DUF5615 family PIN-like protein [Thiothrix subterranea]|uniref:DUF5615 family PIN-like protein n=1 Tax=Thiothrix subterranea TaxID=2735563 RepID=UPI00192C0341|nr:DUF5615 family PIN-like protein [Thiothrix subterranea]QQZ28112.1 DUF5615 family PIN-like protein [Thiothrix subterranea]
MKIIIDECLPRRLCKLLPFEQVWTVPQIGLAGLKDTELLEALDAKGIDVFVTIDGNIEYQQQFVNRVFGTVVIRAASNRFQDLTPLATALIEAVSGVSAGQLVRIP